MVNPVSIFQGENHYFSDIFRNIFSQNTVVYTVCISTIIGIFLNGNRLLEALVFPSKTQILRSMSPTCSRAAGVLISTGGTKSFIGSKSLSIKHGRTIKTSCAYKCSSTCLRKVASCLTVLLGRNSTVVNLIFLECATKMATLPQTLHLFQLSQTCSTCSTPWGYEPLHC